MTLRDGDDLLAAVGAAAAAWLVFAAILLVAAGLERTVSLPRQRALWVLIGIVIASVSRPFVQDGLMTLWGGSPSDAGSRALRVLINLVVWLMTISVLAIAVDAERTRRSVDQLLRQALSLLQSTGQRAQEFDQSARGAVTRCARTLRHELATWPGEPEPARAAAVAASRQVRACSHSLAQQAHNPLPTTPSVTTESLIAPRRPRLRLPPVGLVPTIYVLIFLPYICARLTLREVLSSLIVLGVAGRFTDLLPRRLPHRYLPRNRPVLFVALGVMVGAALTVTSVLVGHRAGLPVIFPVIAYPVFAWVTSACYGVMYSRKVTERRLNSAVAQASRSERLSTAGARTALLAASGLLHRDLQAAFVLLARDPAETAQLAQARAVVEEVDAVFDAEPSGPGWSAFTSLLRTWGRVVTVDDQLDDAARDAIELEPRAATDAYEVIAEGLLNAVKHAPTIPIRVVGRAIDTGAGSSLLVQVISLGARSGVVALRPDSPAARAGAWLHEDPEGVVLEALIPLQHRPTRVVV